jgi:hypothetical protein
VTILVTAFFVPVGRGRFELYSEAAEDRSMTDGRRDGGFGGWLHDVGARWHGIVESARKGRPRTRLRRWRDAIVCRLAETIAEQRTLWALRSPTAATLRFPATIDASQARAALMVSLADARRHHLRWFLIDLVLFAVSGVFFLVPGPNLIAYYFAFRFIGHLQSWRGARNGMQFVDWTFVPDHDLAELASLVDVPRDARAPSVAAIAARLNLGRLSAFFDRVAVPST